MDRRSWSLLLVLASIWGASYMLIKIGLRDLSPATVAFARIGLAALVLLPAAASQNALRPLRGRLVVLPVLGTIQVAGPFLLISLAERSIASGLAGILVATTPLFTALIALRVDHEERSEGMRLVGVVLGIVGVVILFAGDLTGSRDAVLGGLAVVLASIGYSVGSFILKRSLPDAPPLDRCGAGAGGSRDRGRLRHLLFAHRHRRGSALDAGQLPRARVRRHLRRGLPERAGYGRDDRRALADRRRQLARGGGD